MHLSQRRTRQLHRAHNIVGITSHQHDVCAFHGHIGTGPDRKAHIGLGQGRRIIDAIPDHSDSFSLRLKLFHLVGLLAGKHIGEHDVDTQFLGHAPRGTLIVAGEHGDLDALVMQPGNRGLGRRTRRIGDRDQAYKNPLVSDMDDRAARSLEFLGLVSQPSQ